jgi:hypothetical protein
MNNVALYDAIMAGGTGGTLGRWITAKSSVAYDEPADAIEAFAVAVDAAISAIDGGASISEINLLQSLIQGVVTDRNLISLDIVDYADISAAIATAFEETRTRLNNQPALGGGQGGGGTPIQQVFFFDPDAAGTSVGSIIAPYTDLDSFYDEIDNDTSWTVSLPGKPLILGLIVPDVTTWPTVIHNGTHRYGTIIDEVTINSQSDAPIFEFNQMGITQLQLAGGSYGVRGTDSNFPAVATAGTYTGNIDFINCDLGSLLLESAILSLINCRITGGSSIYCGGGKFQNCEISADTIVCGADLELISCRFHVGTSIQFPNSSSLRLDSYSWATMRANSATADSLIVLVPKVPVFTTFVTDANEVISMQGTVEIDCGIGDIPGEIGGNAIAGFHATPSNTNFQIQRCIVDVDGHIKVTLKNTSTSSTLSIVNPEFSIIYEPKVSP